MEGDDELVVSAMGGERAEWLFRARVPDLVPIELREQAKELATRTARREVREIVDRTLEIISRGVLREASVVNAFAARALASKLDGFLERVLRRAWRAAGEDADAYDAERAAEALKGLTL